MRDKYLAALSKLPPWRCGRLDMNTYLPEPVQVGRVCSDVVRYVYFEDGDEVIVVGKRADEIAFAASEYRRAEPAASPLAAAERDVVAAAKAWFTTEGDEHDEARNRLAGAVDALRRAREGGAIPPPKEERRG